MRNMHMAQEGAGKGDCPRAVDGEAYRSGYDRIFGKKHDKPNPEPEDPPEDGNGTTD
jgi:hypothetical protein